MKPIKAYWWPAKNFGDLLTPIVVEHFTGRKVCRVEEQATGKLVGIGSILRVLKKNDILFGTGTNRSTVYNAPEGLKILALRGPITASKIRGIEDPKIYGDPALLLPLVYNPEVKKTHKVGKLPHYVDKHLIGSLGEGEKYIDIQAPWKKVIEEVLSCEKIISSSLHGIICAEAYGIPAQWAVYSDKIRGGDIKFQDYFLGTGRTEQSHFADLPPIENLSFIQGQLLGALQFAVTSQWI
jgi:pyruvyltransferase